MRLSMHANYAFLFRFLIWGGCSFYLWRSALLPRNAEPRGRLDRVLRFVGAIITSWLAVVAIGRGLGFFHYLF
jgi:hypothetical protein